MLSFNYSSFYRQSKGHPPSNVAARIKPHRADILKIEYAILLHVFVFIICGLLHYSIYELLNLSGLKVQFDLDF